MGVFGSVGGLFSVRGWDYRRDISSLKDLLVVGVMVACVFGVNHAYLTTKSDPVGMFPLTVAAMLLFFGCLISCIFCPSFLKKYPSYTDLEGQGRGVVFKEFWSMVESSNSKQGAKLISRVTNKMNDDNFTVEDELFFRNSCHNWSLEVPETKAGMIQSKAVEGVVFNELAAFYSKSRLLARLSVGILLNLASVFMVIAVAEAASVYLPLLQN